MITETDEHIIQDTELQYIATNIKSTLLRPFKPAYSRMYSIDNLVEKYIVGKNTRYLDYAVADYRYIECGYIVDNEINKEYRRLKMILHKHYKVRKHTKSVTTPFIHGKIYHFMIENYSVYMDFYLMCFGHLWNTGTPRYDQYILCVNENVL